MHEINDEKDFEELLRERLTLAIKKAGISRAELGNRIGKANYVTDFYTDPPKKRSFSPYFLIKMAEVLEVDLAYLCGLQEQITSNHNKDEHLLDVELLSSIIKHLEKLLDEDNSELDFDKKAKLVSLYYKRYYQNKLKSNNVINFEEMKDLISLVS